jgi:preprotein translocase SecE subunit
MPTQDDIKDLKTADPPAAEAGDEPLPEQDSSIVKAEAEEKGPDSEDEDEDDDDDVPGAPAQLGAQRFVYAAYFAGAVAVAFLLSKGISFGWSRLNLWKPQVGEPDETVSVVIAAIVGALVAVYYYRDETTRTLAEEVASELGKVTWPARDEVVSGTFVVIVTTLVATAFFALMDRFWGFVTNLVYGA